MCACSKLRAGRSHGHRLLLLSFAALGIVYGDIGTSPLYAIRECFHGAHAVASTHDNVLGVLSLIFWAGDARWRSGAESGRQGSGAG